ncbi:hypothetical protein FACS1894178_4510 [Bacteroidia bacterium]|nr:hypothetical protein FACS1894178_4510 [Bacteroidia bacterium]
MKKLKLNKLTIEEMIKVRGGDNETPCNSWVATYTNEWPCGDWRHINYADDGKTVIQWNQHNLPCPEDFKEKPTSPIQP